MTVKTAMLTDAAAVLENSSYPPAQGGNIVSKNACLDACYQVFGASRGETGRKHFHLDQDLHPTIGCGHLVWKRGTDVSSAKKEFIALAQRLHPSDPPQLVITQAGRIFDTAVAVAQNGGKETMFPNGDIAYIGKENNVNVLMIKRKNKTTGKYDKPTYLYSMPMEESKKLFCIDVGKIYDSVIKTRPQIKTYPLEVQIALIRTVYHGHALKGRNMQELVSNMAKSWCDEAVRRRQRGVEVKRATQVAAACIAAGVPMPSLIAEKWKSTDGQKHYNNFIAKAVGRDLRRNSPRGRPTASRSGGYC